MKQKTKLIVAGVVLGLLAVVLIVVNMGGPEEGPPAEVVDAAVQAANEAAATQEKVPDPPIQRRTGMSANP